MGHYYSEMHSHFDKEKHETWKQRQEQEIEEAIKENNTINYKKGDIIIVHPNLLKKSKVNENVKNSIETSETLWDIINKDKSSVHIPTNIRDHIFKKVITVYETRKNTIRAMGMFEPPEGRWYNKKYFVLHQPQLFYE